MWSTVKKHAFYTIFCQRLMPKPCISWDLNCSFLSWFLSGSNKELTRPAITWVALSSCLPLSAETQDYLVHFPASYSKLPFQFCCPCPQAASSWSPLWELQNPESAPFHVPSRPLTISGEDLTRTQVLCTLVVLFVRAICYLLFVISWIWILRSWDRLQMRKPHCPGIWEEGNYLTVEQFMLLGYLYR